MFLLAQVVLPPSPDNFGEFAKLLLSAVMGGQWWIVVAMALVAIVWAVRKFASRWAFFNTDEGAFSINLGSSFLLAVATALFAGGLPAVTGAVLLKALEVSFMAAGGWAALTKFLVPLLARIPFLAAILAPKADGPALVTSAEKIGLAAAVAAKTPPSSDDIANR